MTKLPFEQEIQGEGRLADEHSISIGVWLFPIAESKTSGRINLEQGIPAVTCNLRTYGIGALTIMKVRQSNFTVAIPDQDNDADTMQWLFFDCEARHNTKLPGGWYQLGLELSRLAELDTEDRRRFQKYINKIAAADLTD